MPEIPQAATDAIENLAKMGFQKVAATKLGQTVGKIWENDSVQYARSLENSMSRTPAGENLVKILKEDYQPAVHKTEQSLLRQGGMTPTEIKAKSRNLGRVSAFGRNDALLATHIKWAEATHGKLAAQSLADQIHVYLNDGIDQDARLKLLDAKGKMFESKPLNVGTPGAYTVDVSLAKWNIAHSKENTPGFRINISNRVEEPSKWERSLKASFSMMALANLAVKHLTTPFNVMFGTPIGDLTRGLMEVATPGGYKATRDALIDTGIFADTAMQIYQNASRGMLSKIAHSPGFNAERMWTIAFAGATAKHSAESFAERLMKNPTERLSNYSLKEMGIDPVAVIRQGGKLTQDQIDTAIYRFVDDRVFLNTRLDRSYAGQSNKWIRIGSMYHSYVAAQGHLLSREIQRMWKTGDIATIVKTIVTLGVIFPNVGHFTYGLERLSRGQTFHDPKYDEEGTIARYLDDMSHMGGMGIASNYISAALRGRLAEQTLGPLGNVTVQTIQDSAQLIAGEKGGKRVPRKQLAKQLGRDILYYGVPDNLGKILSHQLLPTKAEQYAQHHHMKHLKKSKLKNY